MKKYLMTGIAALTLFAGFTSCSHDDDIEVYTQDQIIKAEYEAKFLAAFGQPASNQDWGFGSTTRAFTRTWNVNGNQWHKELNLEYDAPVTTEEMNRVFNYVNNKNNVVTVDQISFEKYWVAQIWNGKDDANADGVKALATETYPDQNGAKSTIVGGGQMDKLEILEKAGTWTHCNNFNHADNNDWKENGEGGRTLMVESGTLSFRYTNSQSSYLSEKYIIVPGENIHSSLKGFYYVCFDFEKGYTDAEKEAETTYIYFTPVDNNGYEQAQQKVSLPGYYNNNNLPSDQVLLTAFNNPNYKSIKSGSVSVAGYLYGDKHCDGDDVYTDWIVRISPAKVKGTTINYEGRIMAEDLTVDSNSDWDFNDVVFDWAIKDGKAYIKLLAAGGTLPIRVGGTRNDNTSEPANSVEIHSADKGLGGYMVNTGVNAGPAYKEFVLEDHDYTAGGANGILVTVQKRGVWVEITAEQGKPAGKFNSPVGTKWCEEYANITKVYSGFAAWVANAAVTWAVNPTPKYVDYQNVEENKNEVDE